MSFIHRITCEFLYDVDRCGQVLSAIEWKHSRPGYDAICASQWLHYLSSLLTTLEQQHKFQGKRILKSENTLHDIRLSRPIIYVHY